MSKKNIIMFLVFGCIYVNIEVTFRSVINFDLFGWHFIGYTSIYMFFIGGISSLLVGLINEKFKIPLVLEMLIGGLIITTIEFTSGEILKIFNIILWDYNDMLFNFRGIICLEFSLIWCLLVPCIHFLDDAIRHKIAFDK